MSERWVMFGNTIHLYKDKAPFVRSGKSVRGAIEYNQTADKLRCHYCANWQENLGKHAHATHGISARQYKLEHGLPGRAALVNERLRKIRCLNMLSNRRQGKCSSTYRVTYQLAHRRKTTGLQLNENNSCLPQTLKKVKRLYAELRRCPTTTELYKAGIFTTRIYKYFGSIKNMCSLAGIPYKNYRGKPPSGNGYTNEGLIKLLRAFRINYGRTPYFTDTKRGLLPSGQTFVNHFGSWNKALRVAGLTTVKRGWSGAMRAKAVKQRIERN